MHILFYSDAPGFGGHEQMTLRIVQALLRCDPRSEITFLFYCGNQSLQTALAELVKTASVSRKLRPIAHDHRPKPFQGVRSILSPLKIKALAHQIVRCAPDVMIVAQGGIESGSLGILAGQRAKVPVISYIPAGHLLQSIGAPLGRWRDRINRIYYRRLSGAITISESQRDALAARGVPMSRIAVVPNVVQDPTLSGGNRESIRSQMGFSSEHVVAAIVGRIDLSNKGQDIFVEMIEEGIQHLPSLRGLIVGSGPDDRLLAERITRSPAKNRIHWIPWQENIGPVYASVDYLVVPSKYEGVPLVMIEAGLRGIPVIATKIDGMLEYLPEVFLVAERGPKIFWARLHELHTQRCTEAVENLAQRFRQIFLRTTLGCEIRNALEIFIRDVA